jgi:hypothetical protein
MHTLVDPKDPDEIPTQRDAPSGKWIVAVDRGGKLIESAIARLEAGGDLEAALSELRDAHRLVNGREP